MQIRTPHHHVRSMDTTSLHSNEAQNEITHDAFELSLLPIKDAPIMLNGPFEPPIPQTWSTTNAAGLSTLAVPKSAHLKQSHQRALVVKSISSGRRPPSAAFSQVHEPESAMRLAGCGPDQITHAYQQLSDRTRRYFRQSSDSRWKRDHRCIPQRVELLNESCEY